MASSRERWRRMKNRLQDRDLWPRRWWYPRYQEIQFESDEIRIKHHAELSRTVRSSMWGLVILSLFCFVTVGTPDSELIVSSETVKLPVAGTNVPFVLFLVLTPLLLIAMTGYLHVFWGRLRRMKGVPLEEKLPAIFNMEGRSFGVLTVFIFYLLPPIVLTAFVWKALPFDPLWQVFLWILASLTASGLALVGIRRFPGNRKRLRYTALWVLTAVVLLLGIHEISHISSEERLPRRVVGYDWIGYDGGSVSGLLGGLQVKSRVWRPMNLYRADLAKQELNGLQVPYANMQKAQLRASELNEAYLWHANLRRGNLQGTLLK